MSEHLVNFIAQQVNSGFKIDQIESYLKTYGYDAKDVDSSISTAIDLAARNYISYIDNLVSSGQSLAQIRADLISRGYDYRIIDHAMEHYHKNFFDTIKSTLGVASRGNSERKQREEQVRKYAEQGLSYGLTLENIQSNLISQGFDAHLVHKIINTYRQSHFHVPKQVAFMFLAIIVISSLSFFMFGGDMSLSSTNGNGLEMQERLLDLESENAHPNRELEPGDTLYYSITTKQMGTEREIDVDFTYQILDNEGDAIRTTRDTKAIVSNLAGDISIPSSIEPGRYEFIATADYAGEHVARTSFDFSVISEDDTDRNGSEENVTDEEDLFDDVDDVDDIDNVNSTDNQGNDSEDDDIVQENDSDIDVNPDDLLDDVDDDEISEIDEEIPDVDDPDFDENDFDIQDLSSSSLLTNTDKSRLRSLIEDEESDYANYLCTRINHDTKEDQCISFVATESNDKEMCDDISSDERKQVCYLDFAKGSTDNSVCDDITISNLNTLCRLNVLKNKNIELQNINDPDEYESRIGDLFG